VSSGLTIITATVIVADFLREQYGSANIELRFYWIMAGTLAGLVSAAAVSWHLLDPLPSTYRRGGLAIVSAFATVLLMLLCTPVFEIFGRTGLLAFGLFCVVAAASLGTLARRRKAEIQK
jgi:hypothetical protein